MTSYQFLWFFLGGSGNFFWVGRQILNFFVDVILSQIIDVTLLHFLTSYITLSCDANVTLKILRERVRVGEKREREREKREERREKREERRERES